MTPRFLFGQWVDYDAFHKEGLEVEKQRNGMGGK